MKIKLGKQQWDNVSSSSDSSSEYVNIYLSKDYGKYGDGVELDACDRRAILELKLLYERINLIKNKRRNKARHSYWHFVQADSSIVEARIIR